MKKVILYILILAIFIPTTLGVFTPKTAQASCVPSLSATITGGFKITDCINEVSTLVVFPIVGKFLQVSGFLFGLSVKANLGIANLVDTTTNGGSVIGEVWKNIRDLSSIFFIGMLLYASFAMILGVSGPNVNQLIVSMVLAGLLINFSLFGTRLIIDASNTVSLLFYNAITPAGSAATYDASFAGGLGGGIGRFIDSKIDDGGISNNIMSALEMQTLFASVKQKPGQWVLQSIVTMIGGTFLMIIAGLAFLAGALMFAYRLVILILLMAFSPLPVIAMILPQTGKYAKEWTDTLISQCLFAPIYLFLMYVALKIATDQRLIALFGAQRKTGLADVMNLNNAAGLSVGPLLQYTIVIMLMYYALVAAKSYGGHGADMGIKWMKGVQSWGQGFVGRNFVARPARMVGNLYDKALSDPKSGRVTSVLAKIGKVTGVDRGIRETLSSIEKDKYGNTTLEGEEKADKARLKDLKNLREGGNRTSKIENALKVLKNGGTEAELGKAHSDLKDAIKTMSSAELKELDKDTLKNEHFAARLSSSQFESLMKNDDISESDKNKIKEARATGVTKLINSKGTVTKKNKDGKEETNSVMGPNELLAEGNIDLAKLSTENLEKLAPYLSRGKYENLMKENDNPDRNISEAAKEKITAARKKFLESKMFESAPVAPDSADAEAVGRLVKSMKPDELFPIIGNDLAKLTKLAPYLQNDHLQKIVSEFDKDTQLDIAMKIIDLDKNVYKKVPGIGFARKVWNLSSTHP
ncbi:MAG: hypothetical protein HZA80_00745 [Candidatus Taylorbacteria bacterium]|nr:hypothetical protein [Candidatus Taylorbacteria bacterium]